MNATINVSVNAPVNASVVIPVHNGIDDLPTCLGSLVNHGFAAFEVIVVDDASTDGSAEYIAEHFPTVRLIRNKQNRGFSGSCNVGLQQAQGRVLVILNVDTCVHDGWLAGLVQALEDDLQSGLPIGMAGSKAYYADGTIQHAGGVLDATGNGSHRGQRECDNGQFEQLVDVEYAAGSSLAISRQLYEQIGGLDAEFMPIYFEDVDWCLRARAAGYRVVYTPMSVLSHYERSTLADQSHRGNYIFQRNRIRLILKHWPLQRFLDEFVPAEAALLDGISEGGEGLVAAMHRAYLYNLSYLPEIGLWRQHAFGKSDEEPLMQALLELRLIYPLKPVFSHGFASEAEASNANADLLAQLAQNAIVRGRPFRSDVPLVGPLIAWIRQRWNRVSTEWYVQGILQQQNQFNEDLLRALNSMNQIEYQQRRLADVFTEYIRESSREIGELTQEVQRLRDEQSSV